MDNTIGIGDWVHCSAHENKTGTVTGIKRDIGNGQRFALINMDHTQPAIVEPLPVAELHIIKKHRSNHVV